MDHRISGSAEEEGPLSGRSARAGAAGATHWTAATTLPAPLAILCARFWPSGVLAPHTVYRLLLTDHRFLSSRSREPLASSAGSAPEASLP